MKNTFLISLACVFISAVCSAQTIGRQSINPLGFSSQNGGYYLSQTLGQVEYTTQENGAVLTQGFQQPSDLSAAFEIEINYPECLSDTSTFEVLILPSGECFLGDVSFTWNGEEGTNTYLALPNEILELSVSSELGCVLSELVNTSIPSQVLPCEEKPYNLITPNGDGENDRWTAEHLPEDNYSFRLWNRWGDLLYEAANFDVVLGWDGRRDNGDELPVGAYFYELEGLEHRFSGSINLLR